MESVLLPTFIVDNAGVLSKLVPMTTGKWVVRFRIKGKDGRIRLRVQRYRAESKAGAEFACVRWPGRVVVSAKRVAHA